MKAENSQPFWNLLFGKTFEKIRKDTVINGFRWRLRFRNRVSEAAPNKASFTKNVSTTVKKGLSLSRESWRNSVQTQNFFDLSSLLVVSVPLRKAQMSPSTRTGPPQHILPYLTSTEIHAQFPREFPSHQTPTRRSRPMKLGNGGLPC